MDVVAHLKQCTRLIAALEPIERPSTTKEEPEWAGLAEKRRSRLAST